MKIGDKVRFLSESGGGKIAGFQKGGIVLVEDEDGFQIPTLASQVVVIEDGADDYTMFKPQAKPKQEAGTYNRSVKSLMNDVEDDAPLRDEDDPFDDPSLGEITFQAPVSERKGGDRLSAYLAFVPVDSTVITGTRFEMYLINDCNYYFHYSMLTAEGNAWTLRSDGELEPNTKTFIEEIGREDLESLQHVGIQLLPYKRDKSFVLKPTVDIQLKIDGVKFYKLHTFQPSHFFEKDALLFTIIENDSPARPLVVDAKELKRQMYADANTKKPAYETRPSNEDKPDKDGKLVIDLHAEEILETTKGMDSVDILQYQIDIFRKTVEKYKKQHGVKLIFIHGKGEGVLRRAIINELTYRYKQLRYQDASFQEYGYGATQVTI